jgi:transposase
MLRLRSSTSTRNGRTYRYYQLARAVRRGGRPTHEIVAHVGRLSSAEAEAIRRGLRTLKAEGELPGDDSEEILVRLKDVLGQAALRYLDLMVVRCLWNEWKLTDFFAQHLPAGDAEMPPADVVFVLAANRCVAPCSKLRVTEWAPNTALPELLKFEPGQLNNTRIHRVLDALEGIEAKLSRFFIEHPTRHRHADSVVYLDLTSTWFEGHGGTLGQRSRTKDGAIRRHVVHLALGVDAQGLPLHWEVLPGKTAEVHVMPSWIEALAQHETLRELPLVFDRGLTSEDNLHRLVTKQRRFVTCARESQVEAWNLGVDLQRLTHMSAGAVPDRKALTAAGLKATDDEDIYHVDQGVRAPLGMKSLAERGLRVVPYFRPSLFIRNRDSLERVCRNVEGKIAALNNELQAAQRDRDPQVLRRKVDELLRNFQVPDEYSVRIEPLEIAGSKKPVQSFQVCLERRETPSSRKLNAGWMVLLAHPDDTRSPLDLIRQYHAKEVVEHAFAVIKSVVDLRPIHHQKDLKIKAHVTLCVLALLVNRHLELRLHKAGIHDAIDRVYETLEPCRLQILSDRTTRGRHYTITQAGPQQLRLLEALGLSHLVEQETTRSLHPRRY